MSKPRLTETDYQNAANTLGCEVEAIKAVAFVESAGDGFDEFDRPKILFERHLFRKYTRGIYNASHPGISGPQGGYGAGGAHQYVRFSEAFELNPVAAMMSASWGKFQILGANFAICGYLSVGEFVDAMKEGEGQQLDAFCEFVIHNHLDDEITAHDWKGFAKGYNGANYRINNYDGKMKLAYEHYKLSSPHATPLAPISAVPSPFDSKIPPTIDSSQPTAMLAPVPDVQAAPEAEQPPIPDAGTSETKTVAPLESGGQVSSTVSAVQPSFVQQVQTTITTKLTAITTFIGGLGALGSALLDKAQDFASRNAAIIAGIALVGLAVWYLKSRQDKAHAMQLALVNAAANPQASTVTITK